MSPEKRKRPKALSRAETRFCASCPEDTLLVTVVLTSATSPESLLTVLCCWSSAACAAAAFCSASEAADCACCTCCCDCCWACCQAWAFCCNCCVSCWICCCWAAKASFNAWTSAAVTAGVAVFAATLCFFLGGGAAELVCAHTPAVVAASVRAVSKSFLADFMEWRTLLFEFGWTTVLTGGIKGPLLLLNRSTFHTC